MKKLNSFTIELKDTKSYFIAGDILNLAFNFLDKDKGYTNDTITRDIEKKQVTINISFTANDEAYKIREVLELFESLDLFADVEEDLEES